MPTKINTNAKITKAIALILIFLDNILWRCCLVELKYFVKGPNMNMYTM